jgi:hypothetical protein
MGGRRASYPIPSTLQDSLMARLDRLATVREIAQVGATIGREFNYALLQAVSPLNEEALQHGLRQLVEAELVFQSGVPPQARYLQACTGAGYSLPVLAQEPTPTVAPTGGTGVGEAVSADRRAAAGVSRASLHRGRPNRAGHSVLAAGRTAGDSTVSPSGGSYTPHDWLRVGQNFTRYA